MEADPQAEPAGTVPVEAEAIPSDPQADPAEAVPEEGEAVPLEAEAVPVVTEAVSRDAEAIPTETIIARSSSLASENFLLFFAIVFFYSGCVLASRLLRCD